MCQGVRKVWRNCRMAVFIEDKSPDSAEHERFINAAKARGIPTTKPRRATGALASSLNLLLPDALATGNLDDSAECRGASADRGQEDRAGEWRGFC